MKQNSGGKTKLMALFLALAVAPVFAADTAVDSKAIAKALSAVPTPELAPTAAKLVKEAPADQLEATVREVVRAAVKVSAPSSVTVAGTISAEKPEMAPVAAGTAAVLAPKRAVTIAKASAISAPKQAGKIVQAVCEAAPKQYKEIALAVSQAVPGAGKDILDGLAMALPNLRDRLAQSAAIYNGTISTAALENILSGNSTVVASAKAPGAPTRLDITPDPGPPFVAPIVSPNEIPTSYNNPEQPGGRPPPAP